MFPLLPLPLSGHLETPPAAPDVAAVVAFDDLSLETMGPKKKLQDAAAAAVKKQKEEQKEAAKAAKEAKAAQAAADKALKEFLKDVEEVKKKPDYYSVGVLGCPVGGLITGVDATDETGATDAMAKVNVGVVLRVHGTYLPANAYRRRVLEQAIAEKPEMREAWNRKLASVFGVSMAQAVPIRAWAQDAVMQTDHSVIGLTGRGSAIAPGTQPFKDPQGNEVKFGIVELGAWATNDHMVKAAQAYGEKGEEAALTIKQIAQKLDDWQTQTGNNKLAGIWSIRGHIFKRAEESHLDPDQEKLPNIDVLKEMGIEGETGEIHSVLIQGKKEKLRVRVTRKGTIPKMDDVGPMLAKVFGEDLGQQWVHIRNMFETHKTLLRAGPLKSAFQKFVRVRARTVELPSGEKVAGSVFACACLAVCATTPPAYLPDLHISVPGHVAALKRAAIVFVEDALPQGGERVIMSAALLALVAGRGHPISEPGFVALLRHFRRLFESDDVFAFRDNYQDGTVPLPKREEWQKEYAGIASACIHELRSFDGDLKMYAKYAEADTVRVNRHTSMPARTVPWYHLCDHHVYEGIGHLSWFMQVDTDGVNSFAPRLGTQIFNRVTGHNPRYLQAGIDEDNVSVKEVRAAQRLLANKILYEPLTQLVGTGKSETIHISLDAGVMAGAVGPVDLGKNGIQTSPQEDMQDSLGDTSKTKGTKWELLVILGIANPQEKVILKPLARGQIEDPRPQPTATAVEKAIAKVRTMTLPAKSDLLVNSPNFWYSNGRWKSQDGPWYYLSDNSGENPKTNHTSITVFELPPPSWASQPNSGPSPLEDDEAMKDALKVAKFPLGVCTGAKEIIMGICSTIGRPLTLRMLSMIRSRPKGVFSMPTPTKQGGIKEGQPGAYKDDWKVYRALLLISRVVPGALWPKTPPKFSVENLLLLQWLQSVLTEASRHTAVAQQTAPFWSPRHIFERPALPVGLAVNVDDYPHQPQLVELMKDRDANSLVDTPSHFLVLPTGAGKTVIAFWYALAYASRNSINRIVWLTTDSTLDSHLDKLKEYVYGRSDSFRIEKWSKDTTANVVLVHHGQLSNRGEREDIVEWVQEGAATTFLVVDEVHKLFGSTIRSSNALRMADSVQKSILATAIPPVFSPAYPLSAEWLRRSIAFPASNETVAISAIASARVKEPYTKVSRFVKHETTSDQMEKMKVTLATSRSWGTVAKQAREFALPTMVNKIVDEAVRDRQDHPRGGVFVCAADNSDANLIVEEVRKEVKDRGLDLLVERRPFGHGDLPSNHFDNPPAEIEAPAVLVETTSRAEGYDLDRLGVTVTSVLASSPATRIQIRGRIARMARQKRETIYYYTVYPTGTVLEFLLQRQASLDSKIAAVNNLGAVIEAFAKENNYVLAEEEGSSSAADAMMPDAEMPPDEEMPDITEEDLFGPPSP